MKFFGPAMILAALGCSQPHSSNAQPVTPPVKPIVMNPSKNAPPLKADDPVVSATNRFGCRLFGALSSKGNAMISPLSISLALRMAMNGASGETLAQMESGLGLSGLGLDKVNANSQSLQATLASDPQVMISIANSVWTRKGFPFESAFLEATKNSYQAQIADIDFKDPGAAKTINSWVSDATKGKIPSIVPDPLPESAVMYLINAVYFKAKWIEPFQSSATRPGDFTLSDGSKVQTPMMNRDGVEGFTVDGGREGVVLPYRDGDFEMAAILPAPSETPRDLVAAMAEKDLLAGSSRINGPVILELPKFRVAYEESLNKGLQALGMREAFTQNADFSKMRTQRDVFVSDVRHKTFIDVTEEGTEAAAVTSIEMRGTAILAQPRVIKFDRPFVYLIRHRPSGQVLFLGVLENPKG